MKKKILVLVSTAIVFATAIYFTACGTGVDFGQVTFTLTGSGQTNQ